MILTLHPEDVRTILDALDHRDSKKARDLYRRLTYRPPPPTKGFVPIRGTRFDSFTKKDKKQHWSFKSPRTKSSKPKPEAKKPLTADDVLNLI